MHTPSTSLIEYYVNLEILIRIRQDTLNMWVVNIGKLHLTKNIKHLIYCYSVYNYSSYSGIKYKNVSWYVCMRTYV